jgi:hypothetical protein
VAAIAHRSAERFGRPREEVAKEIDDALTRRGVRLGPSGPAGASAEAAPEDAEELPDEPQPTGKANPKTKARSEHRGRR